MLFYAKSALLKEQLDCKMSIGCDGIEVQLRRELINKGTNHGKDSYHNANDVFNLDNFEGYPIRVVHSPIIGDNLETLVDSDFKLLDQVFYIANYFGIMRGRQVIVVVHSESNMFHLRNYSDTWKRVLNGVGCLLLKYPYTELAIENVSPFLLEGNLLHMRNNYGYASVDMCKELRKQLNTDRVGTVLDTCHAMMTDRYMSALRDKITTKEFTMEDYSLKSFFEKNADVIKLIHLADMVKDGLKENHGISFTDMEDSQDRLRTCLSLYRVNNYVCPVTIEVAESNYLVCDGYRTTLNYARELNNDINVRGKDGK